MPNAAPADVRRLLERDDWGTTGLSDEELLGWLDDANLVVEEDVQPAAADQGITLSDRRLAKLEAALAGHYVLDSGIDDLRQPERRASADGASESYGEPVIASTTLGDRAIGFDPTGVLRDKLATDAIARVERTTDRNSNAVTPRSEED